MQTVNHQHHHVNLAPVYGIIIAVISVVFTVIFYFTNMAGYLWTGYLGNLLMFLGVLFSVIHYNSQHHERTSAMALFAMGFRTTLWAIVIIALFTIVMHFIAESQTENPNFWIYLAGNIFFTNAVLGIVASALSAMVFKKNQKTTRPE
ncbi:hypothetical protein [Chitinophaga pinensis]|uniref:Uncharacterized protein n=1 Tax=Chitinophaga pinensis (strain ATCC 43595 / DSM 2588 / LMG 13176 / NBRC 15968 / NCIMB 11800 / UQM 2034) TaxID=485918 RepID=A0A979G0G9_CHIPD|nr:hypothetical protein [Chitinophaga pinensis]ACU58497.1 hypothetical protein Cpin_0999 [Chitinophaga pinensis DSM 2588]